MLKLLQEYLPLIESVFVIFGSICIVYQIRQQTKISRADHDRQKKQSTIEFYNMLSTESYVFLDEINSRKLDLKIIKNDKRLRKSTIRYLSRLERMAIGVATDVYDFEILNLMAGNLLLKKYSQFSTYIREKRADKREPMLYKEFELLVKKIEIYRRDNPEKVADESLHVKQL